MRVWRVVPRVDNQGPLWSLQYDTGPGWKEDRVFRDLDMALADLNYVREQETSTKPLTCLRLHQQPNTTHREGDMNKTSLEVIADALGGTYTARGDAVAVMEALKAAGFKITRPVTAEEEAANTW